MSIANVREGISRLPAKERAALAYWIIDNLDAATEDEDMVDAAWRKEVRARVEDTKSGEAQMIPAEEMWEDLLDNYLPTFPITRGRIPRM